MQTFRNITDDILFIGGSDRRIALFENAYPVPEGITYNSYVILDEKIAILDTVDASVSTLFFDNLEAALGERMPDYVVVNHMEPDHCATLGELLLRYPELKVVCNAKTKTMIAQFFPKAKIDDAQYVLVKEGESLSLGKHELQFYMAPMVHWPEVMVTYDATDKVLFSADAFGTFGASKGGLFADENGFSEADFSEARRYYTNIVGKYGVQVLALLKKAAGLDIQYLCPLHGPVWRENIGTFIEKYTLWASYTPEEKGVMIAYASIYGGTENAAEILASELSKRGVRNVEIFDASKTHPSYLVSEAFRMSHLVFASVTYNNDMFPAMETLLLDLKAHMLKNRTVGLIQNGSWAPQSGKHMTEILSSMTNMDVREPLVTLRSTVKEENLTELQALADEIAKSLAE